ncbi:MAG: cupredoxin domain-containing protein, partial [Tepidiformaceae bacterium]
KGEAAVPTTHVNVGQLQNQFSPTDIQIEIGESVTFEHKGGTHQIVIEDAGFTAPISNGEAVAGPFLHNGTYWYYCSIHATRSQAHEGNLDNFVVMIGRITVGEGGTPPTLTPVPTATPTATATPTNTVVPSATAAPTADGFRNYAPGVTRDE